MTEIILENLPPELSGKPILYDETNIAKRQSLFERCVDYFEMAEGAPAAPGTAWEGLTDGPSEHVPQDVICFGITDTSGLVIADLWVLRHHRQRHQWYLGLFLVDPSHRGKGWGRAIYQAFERWLITQEARSILLAVVAPNKRAMAFWESNGFAFRQRYPDREIGILKHDLFEYEKSLTGA
jgi:GNAT superfamily N-acetyltransferase